MTSHVVRTFNLSGKFMYEEHFATAEMAYYGYVDILHSYDRDLRTRDRKCKKVV